MLSVLSEARDYQLGRWPLAQENYAVLGLTERRAFSIGPFSGVVQFNPARAVSTGAKIDRQSIASRPCFLCKGNRPEEQVSEEIIPGWEFLVNPYPIFPLHFTIAATRHLPQDAIPLDMASMAEKLPGMTVFFNGARAGASAPDHLHCQAVLTTELPLMTFLEGGGNPNELPFKVVYDIIPPDRHGLSLLAKLPQLSGIDSVTGEPDRALVNAFMWIGEDGLLRTCVIPRSAHRPSFYVTEGVEGFMVSPGAIDMAGVIVLPRRIDFDSMTIEDIKRLYNETAIPV